MSQFLDLFQDRNSKGIVYIQVDRLSSPPIPYVSGLAIPDDRDVWFTPAYRSKNDPLKKTSVVGTNFLWAEVDKTRHLPQVAFKPTIIVDSGHGYHMYWKLETPLLAVNEIETLNKIVFRATSKGKGESIHNANRVLRVPGTMNRKSEDPDSPYFGEEIVPTKVVAFEPALVYHSADFHVLSQLDKNTRHLIRTGDTRKFDTRSERDWEVVVKLLAARASDRLIKLIFASQPVGDKAREDGEQYLTTTIENAKESGLLRSVSTDQPVIQSNEAGDTTAGARGLFENEEDKVYMYGHARYDKVISTFIIKPKVILRDTTPKDERTQRVRTEDFIVADVDTQQGESHEVEFPKSAFDSVRELNKNLVDAGWTWIGGDREVKELLPLIMERARLENVPQLAATPIQGLHKIDGRWTFVTNSGVLTADNYHEGYEGNVVWLPTGREHPMMQIKPHATQAELTLIGDLLPKLNEPEVMWPLLGWFAASSLKPWIETQDIRFPVLNVAGIRGSGKTTVLQRVLLPLFGHKMPKSYDANTTKFVKLALLGSSNAIPIAFSEFRHESVEYFMHYIRLAYDTGHDPRGRSDQTTIDHPLSAPFTVDGEDYLTRDAAIRQRIVLVEMLPKRIAHDTIANVAYKQFNKELPRFSGFGGYYIQRCLQMIESGDMEKLLNQVKKDHHKAFTIDLPDRIRNNQMVVLLGIYLFADTVGLPRPEPEILLQTLDNVFNTKTGRDGLLVDEFVESVANGVTSPGYKPNFQYHYDDESNVLYFQINTTHGWWLAQRRRQQLPTLDSRAIRQQLKQVEYFAGNKTVKNRWMYGVDLGLAFKLGLDLPERIDRKGPMPSSMRRSSHNGQSASIDEEVREKEQTNGNS